MFTWQLFTNVISSGPFFQKSLDICHNWSFMRTWSGTAFSSSYQFSSRTGSFPSPIHAITLLMSHQQTMRQFRNWAGFRHSTVLNILSYLTNKSQQFIDEYTSWDFFSDKWWPTLLVLLVSNIIRQTGHWVAVEIRPQFWELCRIDTAFVCSMILS